MCGIVGLAGSTERSILHQMRRCQDHRGPDGQGEYIDEDLAVSLAASRLAIVDPEGGAQPMTSKNNQAIVIFNGEIYNSTNLRADLENQGYAFSSAHSDTEVLLNLYLHMGSKMVDHLNGMFVFAILDSKRKRLLIARDRFGIKPLYFNITNGTLAFASELKSLLTVPWIKKELDTAALYHYFSFQSIPNSDSPFVGVKKLPQGSVMTFDLLSRTLDIERFWTAPEPDLYEDETVAAEDLFEGLVAAVARWCQADTPLSLSLSGGLDSAAIAVAAHESGIPLTTFTLGFTDHPELEERPRAKRVAKRIGANHIEIELHSQDVQDNLDSMVWHLDEPYGGGLPSWFVFEAASRTHKVMLTGTGADELIGHYGKWKQFVGGNSGHNPGLHYHPMYFSANEKTRVLTPDVLRGVTTTSETFVDELWASMEGSEAPSYRLTLLDLGHQLPNEFLLMTDRFSMAHSVEARTPFLDHLLVDQLLRLPPDIRSNPKDPKKLLRTALRGKLPRSVLNFPKRGFVLPLADWLRGPLATELSCLTSPAHLRKQGFLRADLQDTLIGPHQTGNDALTAKVWTIFMFQKWYGAYVL